MTILQSNSGSLADGTTNFTVSTTTTTAANSLVVVTIYGNTTITTPGGFTSRSPQVGSAGHYLFDGAGGAASWGFTTGAPGHLSWHVYEVQNGVFDTSAGSNDTVGASYNTPTITPGAGRRDLIATLADTDTSATVTIAGWANGFVEFLETSSSKSGEFCDQASAVSSVIADGVTGYNTAVGYTDTVEIRSAIIAAYVTAPDVTVPAPIVVQPQNLHPAWRSAWTQLVVTAPVELPRGNGRGAIGLIGTAVDKKVATPTGRGGMGLIGRSVTSNRTAAVAGRGVLALHGTYSSSPVVAPFTHVTITRVYALATGSAPVGGVWFTPSEWMRNTGVTVAAVPRYAPLDSDGAIRIALVANTDASTRPVDSFYIVREAITGQPDRIYKVQIPHDSGSTIDLTTLPLIEDD